jgi:hypothetical protein
MKTAGLWRTLILLATLLCVVMLFAPLIHEMFMRLTEVGPDRLP